MSLDYNKKTISKAEGIQKDEYLTEILEGYDLKIIRFTNQQIKKDFMRVCMYIDAVIEDALHENK